jgi:hypothetical protein
MGPSMRSNRRQGSRARTVSIVPGRTWLWLSMAAAALAVIGNVVALAIPSIYDGLTADFLPQAVAQDIANLCIVAPLWMVAAILALRGSARAALVWLGVLTFTVYNYVIYTFSVPFGPLFLLWVAVFGMSLYSLVGGLLSINHAEVRSLCAGSRATTFTAWVLLVLGVLFALLWLSEDLPALFAGSIPPSVTAMGLPTNPVHILDLAFFLPAVFLTGVWLMRGYAPGYATGPAMLVFLILTGIPILITPAVQQVRGVPADWAVAYPIGTLTVLLVALLIWLLSSTARQADP